MADNKLYLTEGEARAVRKGSDTVDMTDNQMNAMNAMSDSEKQQQIMKFLLQQIRNDKKMSGIAGLMQEARDVTEEVSNKNGGMMKFANGNEVDPREAYIASQNTYTPPTIPPQIQVSSNPHTDKGVFVDSSATTNQNNEDQYNQIVDSAGTGGINMEEIVDFREQSGMDGQEYSDFLEKIKVRGGDERFYDAGFTKGPSSLIENYIKKGGILGNILSQVLGQGKDLAMNKMEDIKDYVSSLTSNNQGVMATEEVADVQGPLTGENKFRENLAMGDPLDLFDQYNIYGSTNPYKKAAQEKLNMDGFGLMPFANMMDQSIPTNVNQFGYTGTIAGMDPQSEAFQDMKNMRDFSNQGYEYNNGGGLFPQMTPQDPLMNSFNKTPLSVLERNMGGNTRPQQYAPKTAAQMLGIVDIQDQEGLMGV